MFWVDGFLTVSASEGLSGEFFFQFYSIQILYAWPIMISLICHLFLPHIEDRPVFKCRKSPFTVQGCIFWSFGNCLLWTSGYWISQMETCIFCYTVLPKSKYYEWGSVSPALLTPVGYQRYNPVVFVSTTTLVFVSALCCFDGPAARTTGAEVVQVKGLCFKPGVKHWPQDVGSYERGSVGTALRTPAGYQRQQ